MDRTKLITIVTSHGGSRRNGSFAVARTKWITIGTSIPLGLGVALVAALLAGCSGAPTPETPGSTTAPEGNSPVAQACPDDLTTLYADAGFPATLGDAATFALPAGAPLTEVPSCVVETGAVRSAYFVGAGGALITNLGTALVGAGYLASASNGATFATWHSIDGPDVTASIFTNALAEGELSAIAAPLVVVSVG